MASVRLLSLAFLFLVLPAFASEADEGLEAGVTLACDTQHQAERFVSLYDGDEDNAVSAVNAEAHDPTACALVSVAYVAAPPLATARVKDATFQIVPILVLGVVTDEGTHQMPPTRLFSIVRIEETDV